MLGPLLLDSPQSGLSARRGQRRGEHGADRLWPARCWGAGCLLHFLPRKLRGADSAPWARTGSPTAELHGREACRLSSPAITSAERCGRPSLSVLLQFLFAECTFMEKRPGNSPLCLLAWGGFPQLAVKGVQGLGGGGGQWRGSRHDPAVGVIEQIHKYAADIPRLVSCGWRRYLQPSKEGGRKKVGGMAGNRGCQGERTAFK